jgi:hypothetical protein
VFVESDGTISAVTARLSAAPALPVTVNVMNAAAIQVEGLV